MGEAELAGLLADGVLRRIDPDSQTASDELQIARRHLRSVALLVESDPTLAFVALYDATRKAISAHMRARGLRVAGGPGQHVKTGRYAAAALDHLGIDEHLAQFDTLRDLRNQSEYDALWVRSEDVQEAVAHAEAIIGAVSKDLDLGT